MALNSKTQLVLGDRPRVVSSPLAPRAPIGRSSIKPAQSATAWDSWTSYMAKRNENTATVTRKENDYSKELASMISKSAQGFKPKFTVAHEAVMSADFKLSHVGTIKLDELPSDLHERLEAIGSLQLKQALAMDDKDLDFASISYTTTDVDAALCVTGVTVQSGLDKTAIVSIVATETEREASWSRLEGLLFHWGCSDAPGGAWGLPPQGWTAVPNKIVDAGGAWQCGFEKQMIAGPGGNKAVFVLVLQVPLRGILKSGGIVFVLKATAGQNTRWLKDEATKKDFFCDLSALPVIKP